MKNHKQQQILFYFETEKPPLLVAIVPSAEAVCHFAMFKRYTDEKLERYTRLTECVCYRLQDCFGGHCRA